MSRKSGSKNVPPQLGIAGRRFFLDVMGQYALEEAHHLALLVGAAEALDTAAAAREALTRDGVVFRDRFGQPRANPAAAILRDAKATFVRLIRELGLDVEPPSSSF
jgi:phage terminase small subunit